MKPILVIGLGSTTSNNMREETEKEIAAQNKLKEDYHIILYNQYESMDTTFQVLNGDKDDLKNVKELMEELDQLKEIHLAGS